MEIVKDALAGTLESSDLMVKVSPATDGTLKVLIGSEVQHQFGARIRQVVDETLAGLDITAGLVVIDDKGALDCAIRARVQTAALRGAECKQLNWSALA